MPAIHPIEKIEDALIELFSGLPTSRLPELWSISFPVDLRNFHRIQSWFWEFTQASKLGMWWTYSTGRVTLHSTTGDKPWIYELNEMFLWISAGVDSLNRADPGKFSSKNLTLNYDRRAVDI